MGELITVITATGARPEAFARCEYYMKRQTVKLPLQWLVVDDHYDKEPTRCTMDCQIYIKGPKLWRPGINTQRPNLDAAIPYIKGDYVFVWEDDDWYAPDYFEHMLRLLKHYKAVGEGNSSYYNIAARKWKQWKNLDHCSLCQTGFRAELIPRFEEAVNSGELFMDMALWRVFYCHHLKPFIFLNQNLVVGIKGMPGRHGIGAGHDPDHTFISDPGFKKLDELIGLADSGYYKDISLKNLVPKKALTLVTQNDRVKKA